MQEDVDIVEAHAMPRLLTATICYAAGSKSYTNLDRLAQPRHAA